jgi:hypothetical protein
LVQVLEENIDVVSICFSIDGTGLQYAVDHGKHTLLKMTNIPPEESQETIYREREIWMFSSLVAVSLNGDFAAIQRFPAGWGWGESGEDAVSSRTYPA